MVLVGTKTLPQEPQGGVEPSGRDSDTPSIPPRVFGVGLSLWQLKSLPWGQLSRLVPSWDHHGSLAGAVKARTSVPHSLELPSIHRSTAPPINIQRGFNPPGLTSNFPSLLSRVFFPP